MAAVHGRAGIRTAIVLAVLPISVLVTRALAIQQITGAPFRQASITGTVRDGAGKPVAGAIVSAFLRRSLGMMPILMGQGAAPVDDRGRFLIGQLPPGEYLVCACGRDPVDKSLLAFLDRPTRLDFAMTQRPGDLVPVFAPTFHPASTLASGAVPVMLDNANDSRIGIDITVRAVTARRVSGQIIGGGSNAATGLALRLFPQNDLPETAIVSQYVPVNVTPGGMFDFEGVPPGRYSLEVFTRDGKGEPTEGPWASVPVIVGARDVAGLVVPLGLGTTVTGRVEFSGVASRPDATALEAGMVVLRPVAWTPRVIIRDGQIQSANSSMPSVGHMAKPQRDGSFRIEGVGPGRYAAFAGGFGPAWSLVESVVTVEAKGLTGAVITMSDTRWSTVEGTVVLAKDEARLVRVLVFPVDPSRWAEPEIGRFQLARVTGTGTFRAEVPAGDYFIVHLPADHLPAQFDDIGDVYMSPERFKAWSQRATHARLRPGETTKVDLKR